MILLKISLKRKLTLKRHNPHFWSCISICKWLYHSENNSYNQQQLLLVIFRILNVDLHDPLSAVYRRVWSWRCGRRRRPASRASPPAAARPGTGCSAPGPHSAPSSPADRRVSSPPGTHSLSPRVPQLLSSLCTGNFVMLKIKESRNNDMIYLYWSLINIDLQRYNDTRG